jgi:hypothetical protein
MVRKLQMFKPRLFLAIIYLAIVSNAVLAIAPDTVWTRRYNGPADDIDYAFGCAVDNSGNLYVTGASNFDYLTLKYNTITGDTIWSAQYANANNGWDIAYCCAVDNSGNLYVSGFSSDSAGSENLDYFDCLTMRYSSITGDTAWSRLYKGPVNGMDVASGCAIDDSGYLYVAGYTDNGVSYDYDYFTIKYNPITGDTIWTSLYNGPANGLDNATSCVIDDSGNLYVTGYSANGANWDYLTIKYNTINGDTLWTRRYNGPADGYDYARGCAIDDSGNLYVTGYSSNGGNDDYLTIKYNSVTGDTLWTRRYNGLANGNDCARGCAVDDYGNLYVTGYSFNGANDDYLTVKYDILTGDTVWTCRYNGSSNGDDLAFACAVDNSGNLYVTGSSSNGSNLDYLTIKYNTATGVAGKPDMPITNGKIRLEQNSPNPLKQHTKISYQLLTAGHTSLVVYNIAGQKIKTLVNEAQNIGTHNVTWNGQDESGKPVSAGIYFYRLQTGNSGIARKMIVVR